jgi:hypothetical protein
MVVVAAIIGLLVQRNGASTSGAVAPMGAFAWLAQTHLPVGWARLDGPPSLGGLPIPPRFHAVPGDPGTLSAALLGPGDVDLGYLNATPLQASEHLQGWPTFRLEHLRDDNDLAVRQNAAVRLVRTSTGLRSCVVDDYVTRVGAHHFQEVACLVIRHPSGGVVVAAVPSGDPAHVWPVLENAIASYPLT